MALTRSQARRSDSLSPQTVEGSMETYSMHSMSPATVDETGAEKHQRNSDPMHLSSPTESENEMTTMIVSLGSVNLRENETEPFLFDSRRLPRMKPSSNPLTMKIRDSFDYKDQTDDSKDALFLSPAQLSQETTKYFVGFSVHRVEDPSKQQQAPAALIQQCSQEEQDENVAPFFGPRFKHPIDAFVALSPKPSIASKRQLGPYQKPHLRNTPPSAHAIRRPAPTRVSQDIVDSCPMKTGDTPEITKSSQKKAVLSASPIQAVTLGSDDFVSTPSNASVVNKAIDVYSATKEELSAEKVDDEPAADVVPPVDDEASSIVAASDKSAQLIAALDDAIKKDISDPVEKVDEKVQLATNKEPATSIADSDDSLPTPLTLFETWGQGSEQQTLTFVIGDPESTTNKEKEVRQSNEIPAPPMMPRRMHSAMVSNAQDFLSPEPKKDSLKRASANSMQCSTIVSNTTATPRGVNMETTPPPCKASTFSLQPPLLSRQASNTYEDAMPLMPTSCGKKHLNEIDVEEFMRAIVASPPANTSKKRSKPSKESTNLKPPALQPRISSATYSYDDLRSLTRPAAVKCYSFGSPKPFTQMLPPTPIKSNLSRLENQLVPPEITRRASADMMAPLDHEFFLEAPPAFLRRNSSNNARTSKRYKFSDNFDGLMGSKEADFWCTDLMDTFAFDLE